MHAYIRPSNTREILRIKMASDHQATINNTKNTADICGHLLENTRAHFKAPIQHSTAVSCLFEDFEECSAIKVCFDISQHRRRRLDTTASTKAHPKHGVLDYHAPRTNNNLSVPISFFSLQEQGPPRHNPFGPVRQLRVSTAVQQVCRRGKRGRVIPVTKTAPCTLSRQS